MPQSLGVLSGTAPKSVPSPTSDRRSEFDPPVRRHHRRAFGVAFRMTGNQADAEDLTQEAFLRAFRFFSRYRSDLPFDTWLYKIMSNLFVDTYRRRSARETQSLNRPRDPAGADGDVQFDVPDVDADPERILLAREMDEPIQSALAGLPNCYRLTVVLADIEGLSYKEVSAAMGCPVGAVRSRLHRGRKLLRERLADTRRPPMCHTDSVIREENTECGKSA